MRPAICLLLLLIGSNFLFAQTLVSSKDFGNNRSLLIHELSFTRPLDDGFVLLKEEKKGDFILQRKDLNLASKWELNVSFDPQLNVPQLLVYEDKVLLLSYTVKELERSISIELKNIDLNSGKIISEAKTDFPQYMAKGPYPRISVSGDLSKLLLSNYIPESSGMPEIKILSTEDLKITKTVQLDKSLFDMPKSNRFTIDNQGNVFFVSVHEDLFRMDGYFIPSAGTEIRILPNDILFLRPMDNVADVLIHVVEDSTKYIVAASGNLGNELIGVKLFGFDFKNSTIFLDSSYDFTAQQVKEIYENGIATSKYVNKGSLKTPSNLSGFNLQEIRTDSKDNILLFFEKNLQKSTYQRGFNSGNLVYTYNMSTKRSLQKSEDIILLSFNNNGGKIWGKALQKYQVTKPYNYHLSYVSDLTNDVISILTWTKRNRHSFQATKIESSTGNIILLGVDLMKSGKFTYHKNYSTWINGKYLAITTQQNNKVSSRKLNLIKIE